MKGEIAKSAPKEPHQWAHNAPEPPVVLFDAQGRRFTRLACEVKKKFD